MDFEEKLRIVFGEVLRDLRTERKLSQEKLALESDIDRTYLSLLERGLRNPTLKVVFALAKTLKMSPSKLVELFEKKVV